MTMMPAGTSWPGTTVISSNDGASARFLLANSLAKSCVSLSRIAQKMQEVCSLSTLLKTRNPLKVNEKPGNHCGSSVFRFGGAEGSRTPVCSLRRNGHALPLAFLLAFFFLIKISNGFLVALNVGSCNMGIDAMHSPRIGPAADLHGDFFRHIEVIC